MQKISRTKIALVNAFLEEAFVRGIRGKIMPLSAWVVEQVHPDSNPNWDLKTSEVEAHQRIEMALLMEDMRVEFTCSDIAPAQFI